MTLLDIREVSVQFGGLLAVDSASFIVEAGCVTGLIGPNGAGKTTLFNVITGLQAPTHGRVVLEDHDVTRRRPYRRARLGIARTFQRLEAFGTLTARENVMVALEMRRRWAKERQRAELAAAAEELLELVGISDVADKRVEALPTGTARLVEVARALATGPKVLLLDEPSSGLDEAETDALGALLRRLTENGLGVLLVEHDMPLVMDTCSEINVLDFGRVIARGTPEVIQADASVQRAYLGSAKSAS
jgi:branched-chain amino acid transport system ATP-binding protein